MYPRLYGVNLDYIRYPEQEVNFDVSAPGEEPECIRDPRMGDIKDKDCGDIDEKYKAKRVIWYVNSGNIEKFVKMVKVAFPDKKLSADVFPSIEDMFNVGQTDAQTVVGAKLGVKGGGMLAQLDIIMPMAYSSGVSDVVKKLKLSYPSTMILPDLRGWVRKGEDGEGLKTNLAQDIKTAKENGASGYAIFTYESFLDQTGSDSLASVKNKLGF